MRTKQAAFRSGAAIFDISEMPALGVLIVVLPVVLVPIFIGPGRDLSAQVASLAMSCFARRGLAG